MSNFVPSDVASITTFLALAGSKNPLAPTQRVAFDIMRFFPLLATVAWPVIIMYEWHISPMTESPAKRTFLESVMILTWDVSYRSRVNEVPVISRSASKYFFFWPLLLEIASWTAIFDSPLQGKLLSRVTSLK
eukprot:CAMPEP_0172594126 /NCGR_PEP_ID=MMETSP1068-20121228/13450_1 /TAXON_ID=35684 /ORGANISM="Pseudopedinella elastica, Strain CCMP716" /LENGTH=132 /DNA_ID=CAMNT_0013391983 /DNA_START=511 /DNA_END=909 /DNA_ORIENTATION=+